MRHAQEHWLRLQAESAVRDAMTLDASHIEHAVDAEIEEAKTVFESNAEVAMQFLRDANILIARDSLVKAELLHRQIVRQGGLILTVDQAFDMDTAIKPSRWMTLADFGPWELVDGRTIRRQMADGNYLSLTAEGRYLTERSNSWMFRDVHWCLRAIAPIVTDRGGWMQPAEPWILCSKCDYVLYDGDNHIALGAYRIRANGEAICSECDGDEGADFYASGQEEV